jgi:hypothetical protein
VPNRSLDAAKRNPGPTDTRDPEKTPINDFLMPFKSPR